MGINDGMVIGTTKIVDRGDPADRFNLVILAEGYRQGELGVFTGEADKFVRALFNTPPYDQHSCAINVYRVDVASTDSGADDPVACGGTGATPATYFDASFCGGGVPRALVCNTALALSVAGAQVPEFHSVQVLVNSSKYGGTGGTVGVSSTATQSGSGAAVEWPEILIHEMGHSIFNLADEYEYYQGCDVSEPAQNKWTFGEPAKPNITASKTATGKWADLINTPTLPTTTNPNCGQCDPQASPGSNLIGTFEGAGYYHCGLYRPQFECKMRKLGVPFCAACSRIISDFLTPFDPALCLTRDMLDSARWAAVATILFGVIQDGGGVVIVGGKPIPIDPWGPLRQSLWGVLANPHAAPPAMRDAAVGIAVAQLTSLLSSDASRARLGREANEVLDQAIANLPVGTIR
jgi:hypothetical protein